MTLALFGLMALLLAANAPVAVAIGLAAAASLALFGQADLMLALQRMYAGADSFPLMAVPLFMLAGVLMEAGGISRRIVELADALVGWLPGGLAAVCVVSSMFFAGVSGSAAADTAAVGAILIPAMVKNGYPRPLAAAVQAASGSMGVVIPPSIPMIIFGVLTGASIGKLFAAGILPGLLMGATLILVSVVLARRRGIGAGRRFSKSRLLRALTASLWSLGAPAVILGGILAGVFTATESAAAAVGYALLVGGLVHGELRWRWLPRLAAESAVTAGVVMFLISQATLMSWVLAVEGFSGHVAGFLTGLTQDPLLLLLIVNVALLLAGTVLETTAALILFVPVLVPMLPVLRLDPVQLGAIVVMNLALGMLTPPLGICLMVSSGMAGTTLGRAGRAVIPFFLALAADLVLISLWRPLTAWLPGLMG